MSKESPDDMQTSASTKNAAASGCSSSHAISPNKPKTRTSRPLKTLRPLKRKLKKKATDGEFQPIQDEEDDEDEDEPSAADVRKDELSENVAVVELDYHNDESDVDNDAGSVQSDHEKEEDWIEIILTDGRVEKLRGAVAVTDQAAYINEINEERSKRNIMQRYKNVRAKIMNRAKAEGARVQQTIFNFSDTASLDDGSAVFIACNVGAFEEVTEKGKRVWKQLTDSQISQLQQEDDRSNNPCGCIICVKRRENSFYIQRSGTRSGNRRDGDKGNFKGEGQVLGGGLSEQRRAFATKQANRSTAEVLASGITISEATSDEVQRDSKASRSALMETKKPMPNLTKAIAPTRR